MRKWLKTARETKGLTQQNVADKLAITRQYYNAIEKGERQQNLSMSTMVSLAEALEVTVEWIIEQESKEEA